MPQRGAVAQLGERYNRTVEARGSSPLSSTSITTLAWACSAVGSAPQWHCGGRGFESHQVHLFSFIKKVQSTKRHSPMLQGDSKVANLTEEIEDYCLNKAMDDAQKSPLLNRKQALAYLESEEENWQVQYRKGCEQEQ